MAGSVAGFRVLLTMHIHPGKEAEFEKTWRQVSAAVTRHPANLGHWLMRSAEVENVYHICSDWVSESRFREFEGSGAHIEHRRKLHPYRESGSIQLMHVVGYVAGAGADAA